MNYGSISVDLVSSPTPLPATLEDSHKVILDLQKKLIDTSSELSYHKHRVAQLTNKLFGKSSERRVLDESDSRVVPLPLQYKEEPVAPAKEAPVVTEVKSHKRIATRKNLEADLKDSEGRFPEHLPRKEIILDDGEEQGEKILVKETERLCVQPSQLYVEEIHRVVRKDEEGEINTPDLPETVLPRTCVDATFLAWIIVNKFQWHLPLYRQEQMLKAQGFKISRDTLIRYLIAIGYLLEKLHECAIAETFSGTHLYGDETPVTVCKGKKGNRKYSKSYFWPFMSKEHVVFLYASGRGAKEIEDLLSGFEGKLQVDGYTVYESLAKKFPELALAFCWAHVRRKFIEAERSHPQEAAIALMYIRKLYRIEDLWKEGRKRNDKPPPDILKTRQRFSKRIVEEFESWVKTTISLTTILPKSPLGEALAYTYARFEGLSLYLDDPNLTIDSNPIERIIRAVAIGRKNWMFCASEVGAKASCIFYSLIASCKLHGIEPFDYLVDILNRIGDHSKLRLSELLPCRWKPLPREPFSPADLVYPETNSHS